MSDVVDAAEQYLDEHGLDRPHLAGNSMGGYMAIELARRGRAATVCARRDRLMVMLADKGWDHGKIGWAVGLTRRGVGMALRRTSRLARNLVR